MYSTILIKQETSEDGLRWHSEISSNGYEAFSCSVHYKLTSLSERHDVKEQNLVELSRV